MKIMRIIILQTMIPHIALQLFLLRTMIMISNTAHAIHHNPVLLSSPNTTTTTTFTSTNNENTTTSRSDTCDSPTTRATIPTQLSSIFSSYPNVLCITEAERQMMFHPVLFFPMQCWKTMMTTIQQHYSSNSKDKNKNDPYNNTNEMPTKTNFICPATDFTSTTSSSSSSNSTTSSGRSPPARRKEQLLSWHEFQTSQQQRRRRHRTLQSSEQRPLQKWIHTVQQNIQHLLRYPFRYVIPSIQYYFDHSYMYQYLKRLCWCWCSLYRSTNEDNNEGHCDYSTTVSSTIRTTTTTYIGKYDEDRIGLYTSDLFRSNNESNHASSTVGNHDHTTSRNSTCQYRTVHVGMDLSMGGRVGTPVYAFTNGHIHSVGYNPDLGDYGNVIVIQHYWYRNTTTKHKNQNSNTTTTTSATNPDKVIVYALYGHLSDRSILYKQANDTIRKGQVIGYIGNVYENGGWYIPHLHFQLSTLPPDQPHDMPGAICYQDRHSLLYQYFDPRYVLGTLH